MITSYDGTGDGLLGAVDRQPRRDNALWLARPAAKDPQTADLEPEKQEVSIGATAHLRRSDCMPKQTSIILHYVIQAVILGPYISTGTQCSQH